jgi:hypothetical protein
MVFAAFGFWGGGFACGVALFGGRGQHEQLLYALFGLGALVMFLLSAGLLDVFSRLDAANETASQAQKTLAAALRVLEDIRDAQQSAAAEEETER